MGDSDRHGPQSSISNDPTRSASRSWMPPTAGVLSVASGGLGILTGLLVGTVLAAIGSIIGAPHAGVLAVPMMVFGLLAIVGGVFAIQKKVWGLALVGSISALMWPYTLLGILSIIFVSLGKREFK